MVGAFIFTTGQETEKQAIDSIVDQVDNIVILRDIEPVNKAENVGFRLAEENNYDYFMFLSADTILKSNAIKIMMGYMTDNLWGVMGKLEDYWRGTENYANHLYNLKAVSGYRVDENDPMYDHKIHYDMDQKGFDKVITKEVIGKHHPIWTPKEAFCKHYFSGMRYNEEYKKRFFAQVVSKNTKEKNNITEAAKLGFLEGMKVKEKTLLTKEIPKAWFKHKYKFNIKEKLVW